MQDLYPYTTQISDQSPTGARIFLRQNQIFGFNPKKTPPKSELNAIIRLSRSIEKYGIIEPLLVTATTDGAGYPRYTLIDGERRLRAAGMVGLDKLPCRLLAANAPECLAKAAIDELLHKKLHFFEQAAGFLALMQQYHLTQEEIARKTGLSQSAVANKIRLLRLSYEEKQAIVTGGLGERHARAVLRLKSMADRVLVIEEAARRQLSVQNTELLVEKLLKSGKEALFAPESAQEAASVEISQEAGQGSAEMALEGEQTTDSAADCAPRGIIPRKFALRDLKPLYNSIERTLGIFQKTGVSVEYNKQETEDFAFIAIKIPKRSV